MNICYQIVVLSLNKTYRLGENIILNYISNFIILYSINKWKIIYRLSSAMRLYTVNAVNYFPFFSKKTKYNLLIWILFNIFSKLNNVYFNLNKIYLVLNDLIWIHPFFTWSLLNKSYLDISILHLITLGYLCLWANLSWVNQFLNKSTYGHIYS